MSKSETYHLNSDVTEAFEKMYQQDNYYSEEYALQEFLSSKGVQGYITLMTKEKEGIKVKMCIEKDHKTSNKFNVNQLNHTINHELFDQEVNQ